MAAMISRRGKLALLVSINRLQRHAIPLPLGCCRLLTQQSTTKHDKQYIDKLLVANRGEIACRVMRTAQDLGIKTVAVYSDADHDSMHVQMADEAYHIGPSESSESYLRMDKIMNIAKKSGSQAIHPGYGFLSEKPEFADLCESENVIFVGPPSSAIRDMGIKSTSKSIMEAANVPIIRGYHGEDQSIETLRSEAAKIGYPVMLKAVRGGGGKGMRLVEREEDFDSALESAIGESMNSFGDSKMLIEKFIERPRHVEVQVFADQYGNTIYLYERDCSVQRRHQKIIEEAPAPGISDDVRRKIGEAAVLAAKAVGYVGAGTVEFIMDAKQDFYFMEMNTRLQVEHPVSEMITGLDLVELQLKAAAGEKLSITQSDIPLKGHSFEARIYAEDPDRGFLPSPGSLVHLAPPKETDNVRVETGVRQGDEVSSYYDPMIAKLVVWGETRDVALRKLIRKLNDYHVVGLQTNLKFLTNLASHPLFGIGDVHTGFIEENYDALFPKNRTVTSKHVAVAALAVLLNQTNQFERSAIADKKQDLYSPFGDSDNFRVNKHYIQTIAVNIFEQDHQIVVSQGDGDQLILEINGSSFVCKGRFQHENDRLQLIASIDGEISKTPILCKHDAIYTFTQGQTFKFCIPEPAFIAADQESTGADDAVAPMPSTVQKIFVKPGDEVTAGQTIYVVEAMKLHHQVAAPKTGIIDEVFFNVGDKVNEGALLASYKDE